MRQTANTKILEKLQTLEKNLQRLKIEAYFNLPSKKRKSLYPEKKLLKALRETRKSIWRERYAKKI